MNDIEPWQQLRSTPELLNEVSSASGTELQVQQQLRKDYSAELVRLALELNDVRKRAAGKFSDADQLWLTRQSMEQSTTEMVACHKAARLSTYGKEVWDLCSGAGMDAIALANYCPVIACDNNPLMLQLAGWNAEVFGVEKNITFQNEDITKIDITGKVVHIDPDQRDVTGKRQRRLEQIQPALPQLQLISEQAESAVIKLSPASNFGGKFPNCEAELVSVAGECKAANIWCGNAGEPGLWRATILPQGESIAGAPLSAWVEITEAKKYIYDPDPALVRSGLVNLFADQNKLTRLDDAEEYLTGDDLVASPFVTPFEVIDLLGRNEKHLKKYVREHNLGTVEIKCRHVPVDVDQLRKSLPLNREGESATIIVARLSGKTKTIICKRV